MLRSSEYDPERLRHLLAQQAAENEARLVRRYFLIRLAVVGFVIWVVSWPVPLLPHTVLWGVLATAALVFGLMSPPRSREATRRSPPTHRPPGR